MEMFTRRVFKALDTGVGMLRTGVRAISGPRNYMKPAGRFAEFNDRPWASDLAVSRQFLKAVQGAKWGPQNQGDRWDAKHLEEAPGGVHWKGIPNLKDPYDLSIYPLLLWELKPRTIIELGSFAGGSAVWMADLLKVMGVDSHVYSYDINIEQIKARHENVTFIRSDNMDLSSFDTSIWKNAPRPWLVIEDAHVNVQNIITFMNQFMQSGDYLVVEDTAFIHEKYLALRAFIQEHPGQFKVDTRFTDLFGFNATFNINSYLRKT